jgi:peptide/nickel transport system substrate-binding protein
MSDNYWGKYWSKQTNRRRLLGGAGVAGAGIAALGLVGCGDDDNGGGLKSLATPTSAAGAKPTAVDPFAGAKKGGVQRLTATAEPPSIDPYGSTSFTTKVFSGWVYSRLMMYKTGPGILAPNARPTGDGAETMELSPDGMKYTFKLRKTLKFHDVAPVNGRAVTTDDVKFSYGRATDAKNANAGRLNSTIDKVEYPDASTIVMSLKAPDVTIPDLMADTNLLWIMPTESGDPSKLDPAKKAIGSGPWLFGSYTPSVGFKFPKNPNWWNTGFPLMDSVDYPIILDYPSRLAQFLSGNTDIEAPAADDLGTVKDKIKDVQLYGSIVQLTSYIYFDGNDPAAPWAKDERVRQAVSMAQDRDALLELAYNLKKLKAAGIDAKGPWNNLIPAGMTRFWLDPQGKDQGDAAKFFKYDPKEAKALLSAAGYPDGFSTTYQYTANAYGKGFNDTAEAIINFTNSIGIKTTTDVQDYASKYFPQTFTAGNFKGIAYGYETPFPEASGYPQRLFTDNPSNHSKIKDSVLADLTKKQQVETNEEKRKQIFWDIQRENAKHMYYIPMPQGGGTGWSAAQPYVKNVYDFPAPGYGYPAETAPYVWFNK